MSDQQTQNKQTLIRWFEEVWNQGRTEVIDELLPADCVIHEGHTSTRGPTEFKGFYDRMHAAFSDIHVTPHDALADGPYVCLRWSVTLRHTGDGMGMAATGKQVHTTGMTIVRFANGRFEEAWQNWDMLGLLEQINLASRSRFFIATK